MRLKREREYSGWDEMNLFAGVCLSMKIQEEDFWDILNWCFRVNVYLFILFDLIVCVYACICARVLMLMCPFLEVYFNE